MYTAVTPLQEALTRRVRRTLYLLWAGAGFVLLIGAINIAQSVARARAAHAGASWRLASRSGPARFQVGAATDRSKRWCRQRWAGPAASRLARQSFRYSRSPAWTTCPTRRTSGMDAATRLLRRWPSRRWSGLLIGLVPATTARPVTINQTCWATAADSAPADARRSCFGVRWWSTQVALSVVLLIAATLLFTSFRHLLGLDAGFTATGVVTATIFPPPSRYPDAQAVVDASGSRPRAGARDSRRSDAPASRRTSR